jgi:hypothetical protein
MSQRAACTIITANYLAHAETLAETLVQHNPGLQLYVLIVDSPEDLDYQQFQHFKPIYLRDLGEADLIEQMSFYYGSAEFCWSLRGFVHEYMQNHTQHETWLFLDSDMMVSGSFDPIFAQLDHCSILLNPHFQKTGYLPAGSWIELEVLRAGKFNGGFLGLRRSPTTAAFIAWFKARLARFAFDEPGFEETRYLHGDQLWLDFVPIHFPEVELLRHPGANLAHWNLFERDVVLHPNGTVSVDGQPLLFTHFSGWSIDEPELVSRHSPHYSQPPNIPGWEKMGLEYRDRLLENGYAEKITGSYGFARFSDGQEITYDQRRLYYNDVRNGQCLVDQPFQHPERFENRPLKTIEGVAFMGQELARTHRALTETQRQLASTQQQLNDSQQQLNDSQQQLNDSQQQLNDSQMTCSTLGQQVTLDQSQREGLAQQVLELNHQLTEATQNYSQLQVQHGETMGQLQARIQHIEDLQRQTTDQMQQIALMERSKFWKVGTLWYTCLHRIKQKLKT